jgi:hypothetical protein
MAATEDAAAAMLAYQEVRRPRTLGISATGCSGTAETKLDASANSGHVSTTENKQITNTAYLNTATITNAITTTQNATTTTAISTQSL